MDEKRTVIILRTIKYNDKYLIIDTFSQENGRESFLKKINNNKKKGTNNIFQPLSILEIEVIKKKEQNIGQIKRGSHIYIYNDIPYNPIKSAIAFYIAEFLYKAIFPNMQDTAMFNYILHSMKWLDTCESRYANFHLVFSIKLSHFLGIYPNLNSYREGSFFDLINACFTSEQPKEHSHFIYPLEAKTLKDLLRLNYHNMHLFSMNKSERHQCLNYINEYYRLHIPNFPELKTINILKSIFES